MRTSRLHRTVLGLAFVAGLLAVAAPAQARPRPAHNHRSNFEANKTFGLGIMLGEPSGLSGKYFIGRSTALDFGVGYIGCCRYRTGFHLHGDFLWHPVDLVHTEPFELPLYFGVGGRFFEYDWDRNRGNYHGSALGVRVPVGIAFDFNNIPLDVFIEIAFVLDFFVDDRDRNGLYGDMEGAVGVRYYFN